jgi:hypothetical protein
MVLDSKFLWIYFWLLGSTFQYFKSRVQYFFFFFCRSQVSFRFASFIKKENTKFKHHLQNLLDTINCKNSFKSHSNITSSSFLGESSDTKLENYANNR